MEIRDFGENPGAPNPGVMNTFVHPPIDTAFEAERKAYRSLHSSLASASAQLKLSQTLVKDAEHDLTCAYDEPDADQAPDLDKLTRAAVATGLNLVDAQLEILLNSLEASIEACELRFPALSSTIH